MLTHTKRVLKELLKNRRAMSPGIPAGAAGGARMAGAARAPPPARQSPAPQPAAQRPAQPAPQQTPPPVRQQQAQTPRQSEEEDLLQKLREERQRKLEAEQEEMQREEEKLNKERELAQAASALGPEGMVAGAVAGQQIEGEEKKLQEEARRKEKEISDDARRKEEDIRKTAAKAQSYSPGGGSTALAAKQVSEGSGGSPPLISVILALAALVSGAWVIKVGGMEAIGAAMGFGFLAAALILLVVYKGMPQGWAKTLLLLVIITLFLATLYYGLSRTLPYVQNKMSIREAAADTQAAGSKGISKAYNDLRTSWQKNIDLASGQRVEGDVDPTAQAEPTGISILPPYFPNVKTIRKNEMNSLEVRARVKGFAPKEKMKVNVVCSLQTQEEAANLSKISTITGYNPYPGVKQTVNPTEFEGDLSFEKDISCRPKPDDCGKYVVTITAEADNLRTDSKLYNYVISNSVLRQKLEDYAKYQGKVLENTAQMEAALRNEIFKGQIADSSTKSKSDKGAIMTIIETSKLPLIGLDENTDMTMRVGIENTMAGRLLSINKLEVTIPEFLDIKQPAADNCPEWIKTGNVLTLPQEYFQKLNLIEMAKPNQKVFPSCHLVNIYSYDITEPTQALFTALVDYNYVVQEKYDIDIRNETGGACTPKSKLAPTVA